MKQVKDLALLAVTAVFFASCQKDAKLITQKDKVQTDEKVSGTGETLSTERRAGGGRKGHVYTLSNQTEGNEVLDYQRSANGTLSFIASYSTGGNGTGGGLGNQGAVILINDDDNDEMLLAVNAGSNTISSLKISGNGLRLISTVNSGGIKPVSITKHDNLVFVLNAGGDGNISGFRISDHGKLFPIPYSTKPLSSNASGAAQVSFVNNGNELVVTEKATNKIITYTVNQNGIPGAFHSITSANTTPFGFAAGKFGKIFVSEAAGGAAGASTISSYQVNYNGTISLIDGPVSASQSAACWVVLTDDGRYAYSTNTASNNISSFYTSFTGKVNVIKSIAAVTEAGPIDAIFSDHSKFLYVLNGGSQSISAYSVATNSSLSNVQTVPGLPAGANGMAAN
jgi:6-phosphogluconolactonase